MSVGFNGFLAETETQAVIAINAEISLLIFMINYLVVVSPIILTGPKSPAGSSGSSGLKNSIWV